MNEWSISHPTRRPTGVVILSVQAAVAGLAMVMSFAWAARHPGRGGGLAGLVAALMAAGLVAAAVGVHRRRDWARVLGIVLESLLVVGSLMRLRHRPVVALLGLATEALALVILIRSGSGTASRPSPPSASLPTGTARPSG